MAAPGGIVRKERLDALTDGVFAFAMTLLVINLDLPDAFDPKTDAELIAAIKNLGDALLVYVISFLVLGARWIGQAHLRPEPETASGEHVWWVLIHLFFVTLVPFSTMVVGRYDLTAAVFLYGTNLILTSLTALRISYVVEKETGQRPSRTGRVDLVLVTASALLSMGLAAAGVSGAMWAYVLNFAAPFLRRWTGRE